jgi:glycyl-tRNA synthetase beta chain
MLFKMDGKSMSELLLELFSEEIPSKMQVKAASQMLETLEQALKNLELNYSKAQYFVTPRRIVLHVDGLAKDLPEKIIEKKGPKVDARSEAIEGFLAAVGMKLQELAIVDGFYYAKKIEPACSAEPALKAAIEQLLVSFTWPKSMRYAQSNLKWVRPLRNILCMFDFKILPVKFSHLEANNKSYGHRFMDGRQLEIKSFADYKEKMEKAYVVLSSDDRKKIIVDQSLDIAKKLGLKVILDENLLAEVVGLVEYPHMLLGKIDKQFIDLPKEVLVTAMKVHQRYFYFEDNDGKIAPYFLTASNVKHENNDLIIMGNEKVLKARLSDAKFFYEKDLKQTSSEALAKLARMTFHSKLGSMFDKVNRIIDLAEFIGQDIADPILIKKAALLCKTDLVSEMVGEFPELQGIMGKYYAINSNEKEVAIAISEHYRPIDAADLGAISLLGAIISIADKLDTIIGLWLAGEKPTSSKDPFALRRNALGIIKLIRYHKLNVSILKLVDKAAMNYELNLEENTKQEILLFFNDRLKFYFKGENFRHDLVLAAIASNGDNINQVSLNLINLQDFISQKDAETLLFSIKRILNILNGYSPNLEVNKNILMPVEVALYDKVINSKATLEDLLGLVGYINKFFDEVMVNDPDLNLKNNRLNLLYNIANLSNKIADFSLIEA